MSPAAVQVRTIDEVANADDRAEPVVRETLQMVDEVLAREILLRHRPVKVVLVPDVPMEINLRRHDAFARQIDARRPSRDLHFTLPADLREPVVLDDECGVLNGRTAIARDEARSFEHGHARRSRLAAVHLRRTRRHQAQTRHNEQTRRGTLHSAHKDLLRNNSVG